MVFIKVKNGCIRLSHPKFNANNNFKIGLESMFLKELNLINIETDCKIKIDGRVVHIKKGKYTISNLNKLIEPVFLSFENKKIQIKSPCYYNLDEKLKEYLGFPNTTFDFSLVGNKTLYIPTPDEKYINIDKEYTFTVDKDNSIYKIPIGIYSIKELETILNCDKNYDNTKLIFKKNVLNISTNYKYNFDDDLLKCLGMFYIVGAPNLYSYMLNNVERIYVGVNEPKLYTQGFLKNISGAIFTQSNEIGPEEIINKTEINGNYSIEQLTSLLPSTIKLQNDNNFISLSSKNYFLLDKNLNLSLGIANDYLYTHVGEKDILNNNNINKQLLEVHCNIIEKSVSSINEKVIEDELLFVFYYDSNNLFIRSNPIIYRQVNVRTIQKIEIYIIDQNNNVVNFDDFIVNLDLIEEKTK